MVVQVTLTAIGIPVALESANEARRNVNIRAAFPSREYLAARIEVERTFDDETTPAFEARRARAFAKLQQRITEEPGVVAVTFAGHAPGSATATRYGRVESAGGEPTYTALFWTTAVGPEFFETFDRPIVAGRAFDDGDRNPGARTLIVNEAFARAFSRATGRASPIGASLRYAASSAGPDAPEAEPWFEIVGVVRDLGLDPDDFGDERPFVFHAASAQTVTPLVMSVRMRGDPGTLAARIPLIANDVYASLLVEESQSMGDAIRLRDVSMIGMVAAQAGVTALGLFLSAMSIFSLVSVSVSRRRREIGLRAALGAKPRQLLAGIISRAIVIMASGITAGGGLLLLVVAQNESTRDVALYTQYLAVTSAVMLAACVLACIGPARRALAINPSEALKEA
jgi:hypothetical protein